MYVTPEGTPPSREEMALAEEYDRELRKRVEKIRRVLLKKGFFEEKNKIKKWYMLGKELQFLDKMEMRIKCDPNFENTWRALADIAPDLMPSEKLPSDKERVLGKRNHFYLCHLLGKIPQRKAEELTWSNWNDIFMSFSPEMWRDGERLLKWVLDRATREGKITRERLRTVLKALRRAVGGRARIQMDTAMLSIEELYAILDYELHALSD
ncbi:MAG: hypothetical protein ACPLZG_12430 [Thermoproteota archaeon]